VLECATLKSTGEDIWLELVFRINKKMPHEVSVPPYEFQHNWMKVFLASWLKYPSARRPDVLSVDIIRYYHSFCAGFMPTERNLILNEGF
jgi:hypothetical protein